MMTATSKENIPGVHTVTVRDEVSPLQFSGEVVADLTWSYGAAAERERQRWTDMTLYRVHEVNVPYVYVLQVIGRSVVYHDPEGSCHRGIRMSVIMLAQDDDRFQALEPCERCRPEDLDKLGDSDVVSVEEDLPRLHKCRNADELIQILYSVGPRTDRTGGKTEELSGLSMRLLAAASRVDPNIEAALMKTRRL